MRENKCLHELKQISNRNYDARHLNTHGFVKAAGPRMQSTIPLNETEPHIALMITFKKSTSQRSQWVGRTNHIAYL